MPRNRYTSSVDPAVRPALATLDAEMTAYYRDRPYHSDWIKGINAGWTRGTHPAQMAMCDRIPAGASVLEVGCGDGAGAAEILANSSAAAYVGVDLNASAWPVDSPHEFRVGRADALPVPDASFDAVVSMFTLEHLVYPQRFLTEAWRVLRLGGRLLIIAPDFIRNPMGGEWIGRGYGSGRTKLAEGHIVDALRTLVATRLTVPSARRRRRRELERGEATFPVLLNPRCLTEPGFVSDCDAIHPPCPEEVVLDLQSRPGFAGSEVFFWDGTVFGLQVDKRA